MFDTIAQRVQDQEISLNGLNITVRRLDQIHPHISGNKFYKLKYNFIEAKRQGFQQVITFGGAYSNHIAATAFAAHQFGFQSLGIIRGEELKNSARNHTLATAERFGMVLHFISREAYRQKNDPEFLAHLAQRFPESYLIPEGGTNSLAIQGTQEILKDADQTYDFICCAVGTGGTISGLIERSLNHQRIIGFSALKGNFLNDEVKLLTGKKNWHITDDYCFGGYAKTRPELIQFIEKFEYEYRIPLEQVYTGKMMFGIHDLIGQNYFPNGAKVLVIHSGGLQGRTI